MLPSSNNRCKDPAIYQDKDKGGGCLGIKKKKLKKITTGNINYKNI